MAKVVCVDVSAMDKELYGQLYDRADPERCQRADRYSRWEDAVRCITAGALLRRVVQKELGLSSFSVEKDADGKPYIREAEAFCYNLSHSGNWVVLAWSDTPVGVDVEKIRDDGKQEKVARRFFAPDEQRWIQSDRMTERFFQVWTGKESYLKYLGTGLRQPLDSFSVLEENIRKKLRHWVLEGNYSLTVCTEDAQTAWAQLKMEELL